MGICPTKYTNDKTITLPEPEIIVNAVQLPRKQHKSKSRFILSKKPDFHTISFEYLLTKREEIDILVPPTLPEMWRKRVQIIKSHNWNIIREIEISEHKRARTLNKINRAIYDDRGTIETSVFERMLSVIGRHMTKMNTLSIDLSRYSNVKKTLGIFADISQRVLLIENIKLICCDPNGDITDDELKLIRLGINKHQATLKSLTLIFKSCQNITDHGVQLLISKIGHLSLSLTHLALSFESCSKLTDESLVILGSRIGRYLVQLQHLELSFGSCSTLTETGLQDMARKLCHRLTDLKKICFHFEHCSRMATDKSLEILVSSFGAHFKKLTHFTFNMTNLLEFTDKGQQCFGENLRKFPALNELNLSFQSCKKLTDKGFQLLASQISQLSKLNQFAFKISHPELNTDNLLQRLLFAQNYPFLQALHLSLAGCINLTDKGLSDLASALSAKCSSLKSLTLNFSRCDKLTDAGVASLFKGIGVKYLGHLETLDLDFSWCKQLTFECLAGFQIEINGRLTKLRKLSLVLFKCEKILPVEMRELKENLNFIPSLCLL